MIFVFSQQVLKLLCYPLRGLTYRVLSGGERYKIQNKSSISLVKRKAIVIGGGLLGLECARGLLDQGMDVTVLHLAEWLMEMQLDRKAGDMLRADLEKQGMKFELQANSKRIIGDEDVEAVELADGRVIETDLVVMAVGIRPYTEVAKDAGLDVQRGIVVNDFLQTSDSNIYAIGEC